MYILPQRRDEHAIVNVGARSVDGHRRGRRFVRRVVAVVVSSLVVALAVGSLWVTLSPSDAAASGATSDAIPNLATVLNGSKRVLAQDFPDPGFSKLGGSYYLFKTGRGFRNTTSDSPRGSYGSLTTSMLPEHEPPWMGRTRRTARWRAWAPNVFAVTIDGSPRYVMYFTAYHETKRTNCIGVALSRSPRVGYKFVPGSTICSPWAAAPHHYEAIDPTHYRAADGVRYLLYKTSEHNKKNWQIRAVRMNRYGTRPAIPKADRAVMARNQISGHMEAPSILRRNGSVWLFTSRGRWNHGCDYHTDVWRADKFWGGTFRFVKNILTVATTHGLCGPGGAHVIRSGGKTFIAFHAWKDIAHTDEARQPYVGQLGWNDSGIPYLKGIRLPPIELP